MNGLKGNPPRRRHGDMKVEEVKVASSSDKLTTFCGAVLLFVIVMGILMSKGCAS